MLPDPSFLPRPSLLPRLMMQVAASALLTAFYTPGGAVGWTLDLLLRSYFAVARRASAWVRPSWFRRVVTMIPTGIVEK
jgi:hypothetical protein